MIRIFFIITFFYTSLSFSQEEASNWCFGGGGWIKFNPDGSVTPKLGCKISAGQGCSTISDSNGNLLLYSNGYTIWNKNHQEIVTYLLGTYNSTQTSAIVQKPGSTNLYYVFTVDARGGDNGIRYTEIDMNLNGGLGGLTANKNVPVYSPTCEKITVVKHANGIDYWIIMHGWQNNTFHSYLVTSSGVSSSPAVSNAGTVLGNSPVEAMGNMKISPDGKKLVLCNTFAQNVELFDFDDTTGLVSNPKVIMNSYFEIMGGEFSPNSKVLYISESVNGTVSQFDLTASDIPSTKNIISVSSKTIGALQLAINNKIYLSSVGGNFLDVIENPDILGAGCNFKLNGLSLAGTGPSSYGLPTFCQSYFNPSIRSKNLCFGSKTEFSVNTTETITNILWDFGDGTTSNDDAPSHIFSSAGKYVVKASVTTSKGTVLKTKEITIFQVPLASTPNDLLICDDNNDGFYTFDLTSQNASILNDQDPNLYDVKYLFNGIEITSPNSYINKIGYQSEIITAEVYNKSNNECRSSISFEIDVFDMPLPSLPANIPDLTVCDNITVGTDIDGKVIFDLTKHESNILNGQPANQFVVSYYKDALMTQLISSPNTYQNTNSKETIYVKVSNKGHALCFATTSFKLEVFVLPIVSNIVTLKQCDDDIDGYSFFNLEQSISKVTSNSANEVITFHKTLFDAENNINPILNTTAYKNTSVSTDKLFVRVVNSHSCYRIAQLNLIVSTTQIPANYSKTFVQCDDSNLSNQDGISNFDFSSVTNEIKKIFPVGQLLDITYYENIQNALEEKNAITDISNYRNTNSPNTQKIFIRVDSRLNNDCLGLGGYITLKVEPIPIVSFIEKKHCDDDHDGLFAFDTSNIENELLNGLSNVTVFYFDENNNTLPSPLPNPFLTTSQIIKTVIVNNSPTGCSFTSAIKFTVDVLPEIFPLNSALTVVCDDEENPLLQDGKYAFDTSSFESILLGSQTGMKVSYYDSGNNLLPSPLPNPFVSNSQNIKVEIVNPKNLSCKVDYIIPFVVNSVPKINLKGEELVCSNLPSFTKQINAGLVDESIASNYDYQWFFNGDIIVNEKNYSIVVNKEGTFKVDVRDKLTQCIRTRTIKVSASDIASNVSVQINESNTIVISVSGRGNYVYAIDDPNSSYQPENVFLNASAGIHTIYIKDINGCGTVSKEAAVFGIPSFFTPNQDGYNDYWNVEGINVNEKEKTKIQIFDRYGKLLKEITPFGSGWDGNYLGSQMPADDYWYAIKLENGKVYKGHFSLKR